MCVCVACGHHLTSPPVATPQPHVTKQSVTAAFFLISARGCQSAGKVCVLTLTHTHLDLNLAVALSQRTKRQNSTRKTRCAMWMVCPPHLAEQVAAALYNLLLLLLHHPPPQPPPLESAPQLCSRINAEVKSARKTVNPSCHGTQWSSCGRKTAAAAAEAAAAAAALTHNCHSLLYKVAIVNNDMSEMYFFFLKYFLLPPLGQSDMFWWFLTMNTFLKGDF